MYVSPLFVLWYALKLSSPPTAEFSAQLLLASFTMYHWLLPFQSL